MPGLHYVFEKACFLFFKTPTSFSLNSLQTRNICVLSLICNFFLLLLLLTFSPSCLSQASNGNDPWSVWNADPSGGSNNNWVSNPDGAQTGKSAAEPWGSISQGHPQAYQGPGKKKFYSYQL